MLALLKPLTNSTVIVVAIGYAIFFVIAGAAGLFGIFLFLVTMFSFASYSYQLLRNFARGLQYFEAPGAESFSPFHDVGASLHFVLFAALLMLIITTPYFVEPVRWLALAFWIVVFPASAAIMGITMSATAALNPASIAHLMAALGRDYWRLLGATLLLVVFALVLEALIAPLGFLAAIPSEAVTLWAWLALLAVIGETVGRRRFELAVPGVESDTEYEERHRHADWQKTLDIAYTSVRSGIVAQGYRTIKDLIDSEGGSLEIYQWVFNHTLDWDDPKHALEIGRRFVARLLEEGRQYPALELFDQCRKISPAFALDADVRTALGDYARKIGRHRLADELATAPQV
ncbi:MAG TPA: hypothetical protein VFX89_08625 [Gammaproteobacteria bacterium]|nr:hypothetical protein [Gammaproteobacteria bacterium]